MRLPRFLTQRDPRSQPLMRRCGLAAFMGIALTVLGRTIVPWLGDSVLHAVAVPGAVVATVLLGLGPGMLCVLIFVVGTDIFVFASLPHMFESVTFIRLSTSAAVGIFVCILVYAFHVGQTEARRRGDNYRAMLELCPDAILVHSGGKCVFANTVAARLLGTSSPQDLIGKDVLQSVHPDDRHAVRRIMEQGYSGAVATLREIRLIRPDGTTLPVEVTGAKIEFGGKPAIQIVVRDITGLKQAETCHSLLTGVLQILNRSDDLRSIIADSLKLIKRTTGFDAVGLRLRKGEDYPYYEQNGFSDEFLEEENFLCERGIDGEIVRDSGGHAALECTCGLVLSGRTDRSMPYFTKGGSFWTNASSELLALPPGADPRTNPRNRCIRAGYKSVGLFPLRSGEEIIGILQLNDCHEGRFTPESILFYEGVAQNIGLALQRAMAEDALAEAKRALERERDILQAVMNGAKNSHLVYLDTDFNFVRVNETYAATCGYRPEEMIGKNHFALYPHAENEAIFTRVRDAGRPVEYRDKPFKFPDQPGRGVTYWDWTLTPVYSQGNRVTGLVLSLIETTARKRVEHEQETAVQFLNLLNTSTELRPLIEAALEFMHEQSGCEAVGIRLSEGTDFPYYETRGFPKEFVLAENSLCCRSADGQVQFDAAGSPVLACMCGKVIRGLSHTVHPFSTEAGSFWTNSTSQLVADAVAADNRSRRLRRCHSDGYESVALIPLTAGRQRLGLLQMNSKRPGSFTPESIAFWERLAGYLSVAIGKAKAEEALKAAKKAADAANEAKSQFLANISHELRTPMNAILGMIDVALLRATEPVVQDCLQTAKGSADLLLTILNDLLDSARIESGKLELESAPFSLRRMLDYTARVLSMRASEKGLSFSYWIADGVPDAVVGDRMRLQQVLLNLGSNAIKFTERGEVKVRLQARLQDGDACLEFAVQDTGIGVPFSGRENLFKPFAQADPSTTRRFGGIGLGLSICKSLVEAMGGRIWFESQPGKGSTFYFTVGLPMANEAPADLDAPVFISTEPGAQLRILLVEDNPANQKLASYILQHRGHVVEVAEDGGEAVRLAQRNSYDAILMDLQMPRMDGLEVTNAIRKHENGKRRVPIIAMTAHAMKGDRERCLEAGMDGYLSKPVNAQEMIAAVESLALKAAPLPQRSETDQSATEASGQPAKVRFDMEEALRRCYNSREMVQELVRCFFDEMDSIFPQMRAALERGDLSEVGRLGHRMKGTVAYLAADPAVQAAQRVEQFCKQSSVSPPDPEEAINAFERECLALKEALTEYSQAGDASSHGRV